MIDQTIFKAYDIRGVYPEEINEPTARRIAQAYVRYIKDQSASWRTKIKNSGSGGYVDEAVAKESYERSDYLTVAVGRDVRLSSPSLQQAVITGLVEAGAKVIDVGLVPTEMLYFAVGYYHLDGGIQVSASHNPAEYNGLKLVAGGVQAISSDSGLNEIKSLATSKKSLVGPKSGEVKKREIETDYLDFLTKFAEFEGIGAQKGVFNGNFGLSGQIAKRLLKRLSVDQIEVVDLNCEPDGTFPKGRPDPLIERNREETSELIRKTNANFGVAWDADGDRCFVADENGEFVEGCHLTALLAGHLLKSHPGETIIYDPRNVWAVEETVRAAGGKPLMNKAGHTFMKSRMKREDALFAGEMSGHFYFRDFFYADNGLIPLLLLLNILASRPNEKLSEVLRPLRERYFVSGEINFVVADKEAAIDRLAKRYKRGRADRTDGLSLSFKDWRFNVRASNTENLLRLNVEARDESLCQKRTTELTQIINKSRQGSKD